MGAHLSFAAFLLQVVFLGVVLSFIGFHSNQFIKKMNAFKKNTRADVSHATSARARAYARAAARTVRS